MSSAKTLLFAMCSFVLVFAHAGLASAETTNLSATTGQAQTASQSNHFLGQLTFLPPAPQPNMSHPPVRLVRCKGLGDPCKRNSQCCTGNCVKGFAEGIPGAWCHPN
jgi:hypothetical protein